MPSKTTVSDLRSDSTLDDVIRPLNVIEVSEETHAKMEERMGRMEKQMAALVEPTRKDLSTRS